MDLIASLKRYALEPPPHDYHDYMATRLIAYHQSTQSCGAHTLLYQLPSDQTLKWLQISLLSYHRSIV